MTGPAGYGPEGFIPGNDVMPYRINFENDPTATAPAQRVLVTDPLDPNIDWNSLEFTEVGFGDHLITIPPGSQHFQTTVSMTYNGLTFNVLIELALNTSTGVITALFQSIDPTTNLPPNILTGFLPPEDGTGRGLGHIGFTVMPRAGLPTGTQIRNVATVTFDINPPITTDQVNENDPSQGVDPAKQALNTIDAVAPTSSVTGLAAFSPASFTVSWSGQDDPGGSGIASYDVYVSDNGGEFTLWQQDTTATSATFTGVDGDIYAFYSVAFDNAGNAQPAPMSGQVTTTVDATPPTSSVSALPAFSPASFLVSWSGSDGNGSGIASYDIDVSDDGEPFTLWQSDTTQTSATYTGVVSHTYGFYSVATDNVGNVEPTPAAAEASTTIVSPLAVTSIAAVSPNPRNTPVSTIDVTFSEPIDPSSFTTTALTLTDDGGSNQITSAATIGLVSGSTYQVSGLSGLTAAEGAYTLTVNAAAIDDPGGNAGSGTASTSWLMDTTPPVSHVNALPQRGTSLNFAVSVTGTDPDGADSSPPSGVASYDIYSSNDGGPWTFWTTVPAANPSATFAGQSNTTYGFYSIAHDQASNRESKEPVIEAITYLPDLTPPVTSVDGTTGTNPSTVNTATGTFTLDVTGTDSGGSGLAYFEDFVAVDALPPVQIGAAIPAGSPDSSGTYHAATFYQGLTDGVTHTYSFYSIGIDGAGNVEAAPPAPDLTAAENFAQPGALQVTGLTVEHGAAERSYIRYLDIIFNESDGQSGGQLSQLADSLGSANPAIQLYKYDLNGDASSKSAVSLGSPVNVAVLDHAIEVDFGAYGIGEVAGSNNTTAADGYYELDVLLPNLTTAVHHFDRLLGDVTGDGVVDNNDLNAIAASLGQSTPTGMTALNADVNGDGSVTAFDLTLAKRSKGHKLGSGLSLG
jgi:hypothetical protein